MDISLAGRSAVVTGGSKGIGFAIATRFVASGADVAILARGRPALDEAVKTIGAGGGGRVVGIQGDVANAADVRLVIGGMNFGLHGICAPMRQAAGKLPGSTLTRLRDFVSCVNLTWPSIVANSV